MIANLLIALLLLLPSPVEHRITFYWAAENDGWGNLVADPACPNPPDVSWSWNWCAVSPDLLRDYPFGTILLVQGEGFKCVHDVTARRIHNTIDLRVANRRMECFRAKVWCIYAPSTL